MVFTGVRKMIYDYKVGSFIRQFRIDELPQLISVIKGEMLTGQGLKDLKLILFYLKILKITIRYNVKPGLSGWAQVNYPYGASIKMQK